MPHQVSGGSAPGPAAEHRVLRRLLLGQGPLKRGSDRVEMVSRLLLAAVVLFAVPLALVAGTLAHRQAAGVAAAQAAARVERTAVLIEDTTDVTLGNAGDRQWTRARWAAPDGTPREGRVPVPVGAASGQVVRIWTDAAGRSTPPPLTGAEVIDRGVVRGSLTFLAVVAGGVGAHGLVCLVLARRRSRQWGSGWAAVAPLWAGRG